ncbi:MAG TPA: bifunctional metallophosphatase/5'-nucleotidase [Segetibacter sp.]
MKRFLQLISFALLFGAISCRTTRNLTATREDGKIEVVFVQVNDVYEIAPLSGGKEGGMARVATLKKHYLKQNPNTFLVMAGDFVSPSVYNSLQYEGKRIRGKQMVDAMNAAGMDIAVFGNHEFDITESELQDRINESGFQWVASNAFHKRKDGVFPFAKNNNTGMPPFPKTFIMNVKDKDGTTAKIGFIGLTLPFNRAEYVSYTDPLSTAKELYNQIKDSCDAVVAITHQYMADDVKLAQEIPGLAMIIGGHEHNMRYQKVGNVYITKAHANAKSAYIVELEINKRKNKIDVDTELKYIDEKISLDSSTNVVVQKWSTIAENNYASLGFEARRIMIASGEPLDGRETEARRGSTNLTRLITAAMADACPQAEVVIVNSGSIRVDDILTPPITQYDIIRTLPFGGGIREVDMKGSLLLQVLEAGRKNTGIGGYLQSQPTAYNATTGTWTVNNGIINPDRAYRVAMTDFLITGKEANLDFLNEKNPAIVRVYPAETSTTSVKSDIRLAIVKYLEKKK